MTLVSKLGLIGRNYDKSEAMDNSKSKLFVGLAKVLFNSNLCSLRPADRGPELEVLLTERLTRKKADGSWPELVINYSGLKENTDEKVISDNRDVKTPSEREKELDQVIPFLNYLKKNGFEQFSSVLNPEIQFVSHHMAHANVAKFMSPYEECAILVLDGAGSKGSDIGETGDHADEHEESSLYHLSGGELKLVEKTWQSFTQAKNNPEKWYSEGLGSCYEMIAEYNFDSKRAAGKVMGLAAFGEAKSYQSITALLESLDWTKSYKGKSKKEWEESAHMQVYKDLAASVQLIFESSLTQRAEQIKSLLPKVKNLIIIGGCALNCVSNEKLLQKGIFESIFAPPNPGDEGIGLGCALNEFYKENSWNIFPFDKQHGYFGPRSSIPTKEKVTKVFKDYVVKETTDLCEEAAALLETGETIAWFQGRSESGPRALGNRSILSRVDKKGLKDYLNKEIKFREEFRPYGCSVLQEYAYTYFDSIENYPNPFMSFAIPIREEFKEQFKEVCHIDGTSRIQTVRPGQNQGYYDLIKKVGERTGLYAVLNTSLNIMGEPILETVEDAENFLRNSAIRYLVIGDYIVDKGERS